LLAIVNSKNTYCPPALAFCGSHLQQLVAPCERLAAVSAAAAAVYAAGQTPVLLYQLLHPCFFYVFAFWHLR
jgi:hypothetical protein